MNANGSHSAPTSRRSSLVPPSPTISNFQAHASLLHTSVIQSMPTANVESQQNQIFYQNLLPQTQHQVEQSPKRSEFVSPHEAHQDMVKRRQQLVAMQHHQLVTAHNSHPLVRHGSVDRGLHALTMQAHALSEQQQALVNHTGQRSLYNGTPHHERRQSQPQPLSQTQTPIFGIPYQQFAVQPIHSIVSRPRTSVGRSQRFVQVAPSTGMPLRRNSIAVSSHSSSPSQNRTSITIPYTSSPAPGPQTTSTTSASSSSSSLPNSPLTPSSDSMVLIGMADPSVQKILHANNNRLAELARHLADMAMYGPSCDELNIWCKDERAYNPGNLEMIYKCMERVRRFSPKYGLWSGVKVLKVVTGYMDRFTSKQQDQLKLMLMQLEELMNMGSGSNNEAQVGGRAMENGSTDVGATTVATAASTVAASAATAAATGAGPTTTSFFSSNGHVNNAIQPRPPTNQQFATSTISPAVSQVAVSRIFNGAPSVPSSQASQSNKEPVFNQLSANYTRLHSYLLRPFKLLPKTSITVQKFWVTPDQFRRIWRGDAQKHQVAANAMENMLPLTIQLNAWKPIANETIGSEEEGRTEWPSDCVKVFLNETPVPLNQKTKQLLPNRPQGTYIVVGKDRPVDLAPFLRDGQNQLKFMQAPCGHNINYCVQVLVRESQDFIVRSVRERSVAVEEGTKLVNRLLGKAEKFSQPSGVSLSLGPPKSWSTTILSASVLPVDDNDDDIEIIQANVKVSLRDPIGMLRIVEPVKGIECRHVDCFDLETFLATNRNNAHWKCPHCNKKLSSDKLYRDLFFEKLLAEIPQNVRKIELSQDGKWEAVDIDADSEADSNDEDEGARPRSKRDKDLDGDVGMRDAANGATQSTMVVKRNVEVVSLLSDDEDEVDKRQKAPSHGGKRGRAAMETDLDTSRNVDGLMRDPRKLAAAHRSRNIEVGATSENAANSVPRNPKLLPYDPTMSTFPVGGMRSPLQPHPDRRNHPHPARATPNGHHKQKSNIWSFIQPYVPSPSAPQVPETPATELSREMSFCLHVGSTQPTAVQLTAHAGEFDGQIWESMPPSSLTKKKHAWATARPDSNRRRR